MFGFWILLGFCTVAVWGCSPGGGETISNPQFDLTFYPPVSWTYSNDPKKTTFGQWGTEADAFRTLNNDLNSAIRKAVRQAGFSGMLSTARYAFSGYNASQPFPIGNDPGEYAVELGAVTAKILPAGENPNPDPQPDPQPNPQPDPQPNPQPDPQPGELEGKNLSDERFALPPNTPFERNNQSLKIRVSNTPLLFSRLQWSQLASSVYSILSTQHSVRFVSEIKISKS